MKVINCLQCGVQIEQISLSNKLAVCDYCGAKIIQDDNDNTASNQFLSNYNPNEKETLFHKWVMNAEDDDWDEGTTKSVTIFCIILAIIAVVFLPFMLVKEFKEKNENLNKQKAISAAASPTPTLPKPVIIPESMPSISYRSSVEHSTDIGADLVENPVIKMEKLPTNNLNDLKKTVFAQRKIHVLLEIDEEGKVISAKSVNGHPILQESSIEAAKKSLFSARKSKTTTIFTYVYTLN